MNPEGTSEQIKVWIGRYVPAFAPVCVVSRCSNTLHSLLKEGNVNYYHKLIYGEGLPLVT